MSDEKIAHLRDDPLPEGVYSPDEAAIVRFAQTSTRMAPISERHYYRTGRDTQFNTKVRVDTKAAYIAIATEDGVPLGKVLEDALDALMRERQSRRAGGDTPPK